MTQSQLVQDAVRDLIKAFLKVSPRRSRAELLTMSERLVQLLSEGAAIPKQAEILNVLDGFSGLIAAGPYQPRPPIAAPASPTTK